MNFAQDSGGGSALGFLLPLVLIFAIFYFLMLRPARNRQRQAIQVQNSLTPGAQVMTTAGLFATVSSVEDDVVVLEVAPGVYSRFAKQAVLRVVPTASAAGGSDRSSGEASPQSHNDTSAPQARQNTDETESHT